MVDPTRRQALAGQVAEWFPLLPRPRPPSRPLPERIAEIRALAQAASHGPAETRLSSAAEAHNKAALILSDCGLSDLAEQLCWRQFDIFQAATPLPLKAAKLALQPIVNLGRLLTRCGHSARAYQLFHNAYEAVRTNAATSLDGKRVDFTDLIESSSQHGDLRRFLWTVLLGDATRALTKAGRWDEALQHVQRHRGIGSRLFDGRQVAVIAHWSAGNCGQAIAMLDASVTPDAWEQALTASLRMLCLLASDQPTGPAVVAMIERYLHLEATPENALFRTRLGLFITGLAEGQREGEEAKIAATIISEAVASTDAHLAWDVLAAYASGNSSLSEPDQHVLAAVIESSGFRTGVMPPRHLDNLMASVAVSERQLVQSLN